MNLFIPDAIEENGNYADIKIYYIIHKFVDNNNIKHYYVNYYEVDNFINHPQCNMKRVYTIETLVNEMIDNGIDSYFNKEPFYIHHIGGRNIAPSRHNEYQLKDFIKAIKSHKRMRWNDRMKDFYSYTSILEEYPHKRINIDITYKLIEDRAIELCSLVEEHDADYVWNYWLTKEERKQQAEEKYRWKTELKLLKTVQTKYTDAVGQYTASWLKSEDKNGALRVDIFIPSLKLAIEYQGEQHFKPIDYFGGEEGFNRRVYLDNLKKELLLQHGYQVLYFTKDDDLNDASVFNKIAEAITNNTEC